jgi:hypothetical protein
MILTSVLMRFLRVFDFQINYMFYWRFHFEKGIPINCSFTHYELGHIYWIWISLKMKCTQYGIYEQTAFNPSEGQHAWRTNRVLKDNLSEGQHHYTKSGGHRGRKAFGKRCPDCMGREAKSFRGAVVVVGPTNVCHAGQSSLGFL